MTHARLLCSALLSLALTTTQARAQESWLVVASAAGERAPADAAERAAARLSAGGRRVTAGEEAGRRIEVRVSAAFEPAPAEVAQGLSRVVEPTLEHVAFGRNREAIDLADPALRAADEHLAALGRDPQASADLANACLYVVRAELALGGADTAAARARECLRRVPDLTPDASVHPPPVRELAEQTRDAAEQGDARLAVEVSAAESRTCTIRLNGRAMGTRRSLRRALAPGAYAVQVECGNAPGRVHAANVRAGAIERVLVDPRLDEALRTGPNGVTLAYASASDQGTRLPGHVADLGRAVGAGRVLVAAGSGSATTLFAMTVPPSGEARVDAQQPLARPDEAAVSTAVAALLEGRSGEGGGVTLTGGDDGGGRSTGSIVGPVLLGIAGLGAVTAVLVGAIGAGCRTEDASGCVRDRELDGVAAGLYGALGGAAILGAVLWLALGGGGGDAGEEHAVRLDPRGLTFTF